MNMYDWLCDEATAISAEAMLIPPSADQLRWSEDERRTRWLESIGLWPLPERTPLEAELTGSFEREDYVCEKVHFQSAPGAHVPGNIYRPREIDEPLPAVLYLCGHTEGKIRLGYQQNPRWFGAHGYVALVLDPIQLGESQGFHHGTHRLGRWDWFSRGYTPGGAEVWNAMRALDYLETRHDVDASRMGVTGLSGGRHADQVLRAGLPDRLAGAAYLRPLHRRALRLRAHHQLQSLGPGADRRADRSEAAAGLRGR
jgi:poly(3-hydroxybutyrate) depolymerase